MLRLKNWMKKIKSKSTTAWLLSYTMILIIPIFISLIAYNYTEKILVKQIQSYNMENLKNSGLYLDNIIRGSSDSCINVAMNDAMADALNYQLPYNNEEIYSLYSLRYMWKTNMMNKDYIDQLFSYIPQTDQILCSAGYNSTKGYYDAYDGADIEQFNSWHSKVLDAKKEGLIVLNNTNTSKKAIYYVYPVRDLASPNIKMCIVAQLNNDIIFNTRKYNSNSIFYIIADDGSIITSPMSFGSNDAMLQISNQSDQIFADEIRKHYVLSTLKSEVGSWEYGCAYSKNDYLNEVSVARAMTIFAAVISIVLGIILILFSIKKNNKPIRELVKKLSNYNGEQEHRYDEYKYIDNVIMKVLDEKSEYASRLFVQNTVLKDNVFANILKGKANEKFTYKEQIESLGIYMKDNKFAVLLFYIDDLSQMFFKENPDGDSLKLLKLAQLIVSNVLGEMLSVYYTAQMCECDDMLVCIVNFDEDDTSVDQHINGIILEAQLFIKSEFNFNFFTSISSKHTTLNSLSEAYQEAILGVEHMFFSDEEIIHYTDIMIKNDNDYYYTIESEQKIINCIKACEYDKSIEIVKNVLDVNITQKYLPIEMAKFLAYDIVCTFIKISKELNVEISEDFFVNLDIYHKISKCKTTKKLYIEIFDFTLKIISEFKEITPNNNKKMVQKIISFVNEQYNNQNINVTEIARHFNMNTNYISIMFKQNYSMGLLEYITKQRIDKAKQLLEETDLTVGVIAEEVGYMSVRTFMRVFTKNEGIAPGKYSQLYKKK